MRDSTEPRGPRRRFRRAPDEKRARILAVARASFSEQSYEQTTTAEIARRADVSEGTIFHHFGTKLGLLRQAAEAYGRDLANAMYDGAEDGFLEIEEVVDRAARFAEEEGVLGLEPPGPSSNRRPLIVVHLAIREALVERGVPILETWQASGQARQMDARLAAEILFPLTQELLVKLFMDGREAITPAYLDEFKQILYGAVGYEPRLRH